MQVIALPMQQLLFSRQTDYLSWTHVQDYRKKWRKFQIREIFPIEASVTNNTSNKKRSKRLKQSITKTLSARKYSGTKVVRHHANL